MNTNGAAIQIMGRCIDEDKTWNVRGTLSGNQRVVIVHEDKFEMKLSRARGSSKLWHGHGSENGYELVAALTASSFQPHRQMRLHGSWTMPNPFGKHEDDRNGEWVWELWPVGHKDPFVASLRAGRR